MSETTKLIATALLAFASAAFLLTMVILDYIRSGGTDNDPVTCIGCAILVTLGIQCLRKARWSICKSNKAIRKNNTPSEK